MTKKAAYVGGQKLIELCQGRGYYYGFFPWRNTNREASQTIAKTNFQMFYTGGAKH